VARCCARTCATCTTGTCNRCPLSLADTAAVCFARRHGPPSASPHTSPKRRQPPWLLQIETPRPAEASGRYAWASNTRGVALVPSPQRAPLCLASCETASSPLANPADFADQEDCAWRDWQWRQGWCCRWWR
jgi:hypothetical protein